MRRKINIINMQIVDYDGIDLFDKVGSYAKDKNGKYIMHVYEPVDKYKMFDGKEYDAVMNLFSCRYIEPFIERGEPVFVELLRVVEE